MKRSAARTIQSKIKSPDALERVCSGLRRAKRRIVFTNGCFDILHPGHVTYLQEAKEKGDVLVVALDTDASVRKLKGPRRPVNPLRSRMTVLAALESVDFVTWFSGGNPIPAIRRFKPTVLVKGGDWKVSHILGSKEVLGWGGRVFSLPFVEGKSTTSIIQRIQKDLCES